MIPIGTFDGREVAVFGLGRSGLATCRALAAGGARVLAWDDNAAGREAAASAGFPLCDLATADWRRFAALILAPGVPLTHPQPHWSVTQARATGVEVIGDVELFARARAGTCPGSAFVAITGTNGKSTTTALIAHILTTAGRDAQMGGNIGVPILELAPPSPDRVHVIELSSYQIDLMPTLRPSIGVLLNISPDHLDRHGGFANYVAIKARLPAASDLAIIGYDDSETRRTHDTLKAAGSAVVAVSGGRLADGYGTADGNVLRFNGTGTPARAIANINGVVSLRGTHNAQNAAAAAAACEALGLTPEAIAAGLRSFPGLAHRMEEVGRAGRIILINDSKATNAESTANALAAFDGGIHWIAGGLAKDGGITTLSPYFPRIAKAYLIGAAAQEFAGTLQGQCPFVITETLDAAVRQAAEDAARSSADTPVVLLSPACASFDQFKSFEARGEAFRSLAATVPGIVMREAGP
jgi:UDP-N-acetylmuramoylalanine--D-glutamate ligase